MSKPYYVLQMVYSDKQLADVTKVKDNDALYFKSLDWDNLAGKWDHIAIPWKDHYPNCWEVLSKVMTEVVFHKERGCWRAHDKARCLKWSKV